MENNIFKSDLYQKMDWGFKEAPSKKIENVTELMDEPRAAWNDSVTELLLNINKKVQEEAKEEAEFKKTHTINGNMSTENKKNLETILKHFGPEVEVNKLIEELVELTHAVISFKKSQSSFNYNLRKIEVVGEIADVEITLAHFKNIYDVSDEEVEWIKKTKLKKLAMNIRAIELEKAASEIRMEY